MVQASGELDFNDEIVNTYVRDFDTRVNVPA